MEPKDELFTTCKWLPESSYAISAVCRYDEEHMEFAVRMYRIQLNEGRYFIHEHPASATSWRLPVVRKLWKEEGVRVVVADTSVFKFAFI